MHYNELLSDRLAKSALLAVALLAVCPRLPAATNAPSPVKPKNIPHMVEADGRLRLSFGEENLVLPRGLQPSLLRTASGAFVVQAQVPEKPFPSLRMTYPSAMETVISRDDGKTLDEATSSARHQWVEYGRWRRAIARRHYPGPRHLHHARSETG